MEKFKIARIKSYLPKIILISSIFILILLSNQDQHKLFVEDLPFQPLLHAFKLGSQKLNVVKRQFRSGKIPTFLLVAKDNVENSFWQQQLLHISLNQCPVPCNFTDDKSQAKNVDALLFFLRDIKDKVHMADGLPTRDPSQPWIMLSFEAAFRGNSIYGTNYSEFNGVFNRTMMHRMDADVSNPHGFIVSNEDTTFLPNDWVLPPPTSLIYESNQTFTRKLAVAFISNCNAESGRLEYINEMKLYGQVDVFGGCGTLQCGGSHYVEHAYKVNTDECFKKAGFGYMFYLAFENSICKDYVTEKLYNLLYYPIVPIVLGGADYSKLLPPHSYISVAQYSPKELVAYLVYLQNNPTKYNEYFEWRKYFRPSTVGGIVTMCHLCVKLHDSSFFEHKVYEDFYKWFYLESDCFRKWHTSSSSIVSFNKP